MSCPPINEQHDTVHDCVSSGPQPTIQTPPPSSKVIEQNFGRSVLSVPTFNEFAAENDTGPLTKPDQPILHTEIEQITREEFGLTLTTAEKAAGILRRLKLPRTSKIHVEGLVASLSGSKRLWEQTGKLPEDEEIIIYEPKTSSNHPPAQTAPNKHTKKRLKKTQPNRPVDLIAKAPVAQSPTARDPPATASTSTVPQTTGTKDRDTQREVPNEANVAKKNADPTSDITTCDQALSDDAGPTSSHSPPHLPTNTSSNLVPGASDPVSSVPLHTNSDAHTSGGTDVLPHEGTHSRDLSSAGEQPHKSLVPVCGDHDQPATSDSNNLLRDHQAQPMEHRPPSPNSSSQHATNVQRRLSPTGAGDSAVDPKSMQTTENHPDVAPEHQHNQGVPNALSITIIKCDEVRKLVFDIHHDLEGIKPSWQKYQIIWDSVNQLVRLLAEPVQLAPVPQQDWHFVRAASSYDSWLKVIHSLSLDFLAPSNNELWFCPDVVDFPLLSTFGTNKSSSHQFISTTEKTKHPESTLVRHLYRLQNPPHIATYEWAKLIAASVEVMSDRLNTPPMPTPHDEVDHIVQGIQVLNYLETLKNSSSSFHVGEDESNATSSHQRSHSLDVLHDFQKVVIDVLMGYIILQTHGLANAPMTAAQKKKPQCPGTELDAAQSPSTVSLAPHSSSEVLEQSKQQLKKIQGRHNFQPLVYFLLGGVRGLFVASRNHRIAPISECMSIIQAMSVIIKHSTFVHTADEPLWKNLSAYLHRLYAPVFQSPTQPPQIQHIPTRLELAEAITHDVLNYLSTHPGASFILPHSQQQIMES